MTDVTPRISSAYNDILEVIASVEPRIADATRQELVDQRDSLKLIASENYASPAVLLTMGTWLSDKYAEGTIGHRFYAGCQNVDTVEALAAEHARELFGAPHAYVQPHSGIDANLVAFWAVRAQRVESPALERAGVRHVNELTDEDWATLRHALGDQRMPGMSLDAGLVAGKVFSGDFDPVPHAHVVTSTSHKSLRGPRGGFVLAQPEYADAVDRGCPMVLGGPLPHVMAAKAVASGAARRWSPGAPTTTSCCSTSPASG